MPCTPRNRFSAAQGAKGRLPAYGQGKSEDAAPPDPQPVPGKVQDPVPSNGFRPIRAGLVAEARDISRILSLVGVSPQETA